MARFLSEDKLEGFEKYKVSDFIVYCTGKVYVINVNNKYLW